MPSLTILSGERAGARINLHADKSYVLGREDDCDIYVGEVPGVSRKHARFQMAGEGDNKQWQVVDLESQNGVMINKNLVKTSDLHDGDIIWFSDISVKFSDPRDEEVTPVDINPETIVEAGQLMRQIEDEFGKIIVGQRQVLDELIVALLSCGHVLMIGLPGLAKTLMIKTLSDILDLSFKRIQFTPDLMPSDIVGSDVLEIDEDSGRKSFRFIKGPIFTNMLLADEINRTPPKTQAALLEAMQEHQVTASNQEFHLPEPFFVLATQNPLEQEGTYPLPEAQLDRFMFNVIVEYPDEAEEEQIVRDTTRRKRVQVRHVINGEKLLEMQELVRDLPVSPHVIKYATRLTRATRPGDPNAPDYIRDYVACGAGPRAAQFLILGAKAKAIMSGTINVSCDHVRSLALPILRHRIFTNFSADSENITPDDLIRRLLLNVPEPGPKDY